MENAVLFDPDHDGRKKESGWRKPAAGDPPDLDALFQQFYKKLRARVTRGHHGPASPSGHYRFGISLLFVLLLLLWGLSGIFLIAPAERGVVLLLGRYQKTLGPGPHWVPRFISKVYVVDVQRIATFSYESKMLTKDENIVFVALSVQFRVNNARDFLFNVTSPVVSLQQATASALRQVVGHTTLDQLLTTGRTKVREQVAKRLNEILEPYGTGLIVTEVNLQPAKPPEEVTEAFDDAIKAREDEQRYINQARAYSEKVLAIAQGDISRLLQEAGAFQKKVVLHSEADTAAYLALLPEYQKSQVVTRERLYIDTMEEVLSGVNKVLIDQGDGRSVFYLPMPQWSGHKKESVSDIMRSKAAEALGAAVSDDVDRLVTPSLKVRTQRNTSERLGYSDTHASQQGSN